MVKYDDYEWHHSGDFPIDLEHEKGITHIGFFFTWCAVNDLISEAVLEKYREDITAIKKKRLLGGHFLLDFFEGCLLSEQLSEQGNAFVHEYYDGLGSLEGKFSYLDDYIKTFNLNRPDRAYYLDDCWENYFEIEEVIDHRYQQWIEINGKS
ncbi:DUF7832 domain-containing protein [Myroides pelagicus]|uniref:DUF7832 domain-containing protein n=1 Tax=Myroides pelagicus TaxID=270914 RepID=A0A7K1GNE1_9FLAO|nr:hypothetical protein [Myroides pelagicus]MEC4113865.1 hypothetical protein [Myroides pelagicus]MTH30422.1 hypothetical protein [Myroides pelagicus]